MPAFASPDDVAAAWRPLTDAEVIVAATDLEFAAAIIRTKVPDIDARLAAGKISADLVKGINARMVLRKLKNPDGAVEESESLEDYQYTTRYDSDGAAGDVYLSDDEIALLTRKPTRSSAFSIRPGGEPTTLAIAEQVARNRACWGR